MTTPGPGPKMTFANCGIHTVHFATDQDRVEPSSVPLTNAATETGIKSVQCSSNQWWDENLMMQHTYHTAQCMHEHWLMPLSNALITYRMRERRKWRVSNPTTCCDEATIRTADTTDKARPLSIFVKCVLGKKRCLNWKWSGTIQSSATHDFNAWLQDTIGVGGSKVLRNRQVRWWRNDSRRFKFNLPRGCNN